MRIAVLLLTFSVFLNLQFYRTNGYSFPSIIGDARETVMKFATGTVASKMKLIVFIFGMVLYRVQAAGWEPLGCYADTRDRAMPHYFKTVISDDYKHIFEECRKEAEKNGYIYFGVQYWKECWGSKEAYKTYDKHGCKDNCEIKGGYGTGMHWSNFMYHMKSDWTSCIYGKCGEGEQKQLVLLKDNRPNCPKYNVKLTTSSVTKKCPAKKPCPVDGGWTVFSSWSTCDKKCGGGTQSRTRSCTNPKPAHRGKPCTGSSSGARACNTEKCKPEPCSIDDIVQYTLDALPKGSVEVNNHLIGALYQVVKSMGAAKGIPKNVKVKKDELIKRIEDAMKNKGYTYARMMLGFILEKEEDCHGTGDKIIKQIKDKLGEDKFKDFLAVDGDVSLVFTIDTTGSMGQEINAAKAIAKSIAKYKRKGKVDYILSTYNDYPIARRDLQLVQKFDSDSRGSFENAINRLIAAEGGDCPELAFNGIIDAIKVGQPLAGSPMFVFTDAPPKASGEYNAENAVGYALDYMMPVNFFFSTNGCGKPAENADYKSIMKDTGGMGLFFSTASSIGAADVIVGADLDGSTTIASSETTNSRRRRDASRIASLWSRGSRDVNFPVDDSIDKLIISYTASWNWNDVKVIDSARKEVAPKMAMINGKLWVIEKPKKGIWNLFVPSRVGKLNYQIKASAVANIDFTFMFVRTLNPSKMVVPISNPLIGEKANARIVIPNSARIKKDSLKIALVDEHGKSVKNLPVTGEMISFDLPSSNLFKIRLRGITNTGQEFQRTSREAIVPQQATIRTQIHQSLLTIKRGGKTSFRAAIDYTGIGTKTFTIKASVTPADVGIKNKRPSINVTNKRSGYAALDLTAPSSTPVGTQVQVRITATSGNIKLNLIAHVMVA